MKFAGALVLALALGVNAFTPSTPRIVARTTMKSTTAPALEKTLATAANEARGLAMDSISKAESGHLGLPLGAAEIGAVLWGQSMTYNPADPTWLNRDRFVLSAGHGSMFLYSWLHMAGYDIPINEVANFRQFHSATPGHPEFPNSEHTTPGIEATTGPLGAGISNAVGLAASEKMAAAHFNTAEHKIFDHHVFVLCGDGCLQEGVSAEAMSFAAHEKLDNLILLFDSNDVTLDKMAEFTQSEDHAMRFKAYGWDVITLKDGHDLKAIHAAIEEGKKNNNGKPTAIICKTIIGKGIDEVAGTNAAHGEAGVKFVKAARKNIGLPDDKKWYVSPETYSFFAEKRAQMKTGYDAWTKTYAAWKAANPALATTLEDAKAKKRKSPAEILAMIPDSNGKPEATRQSGSNIINQISAALPTYVSGSADLHGSNKNYIKGAGDFGSGFGKTYKGKNFYYGIREHAMGGIANGISYGGIFTPSCATFLVFADYMRATMRIASLAELPVSYILTHDSIAVGEDGPTHQPVETVSGLRVFPNMDVMRPADYDETAAAYTYSITKTNGPTSLILTRQNVPQLDAPKDVKRQGTLKGGYVIKKESAALTHILIAAGSEVQFAMAAAAELGAGVRVVSMPCMSLFDKQTAEYKESVLPSSCRKRAAMEAGVSGLWYKYVGFEGKILGVDRFGFSAPGDITFRELKMTTKDLVDLAKTL